jgi:hypothetical protein
MGARRLITKQMAVRLAAAREQVSQAVEVPFESIESESWWQGVAQAEQCLADLLREQALAMTTGGEDDPDYQLWLAVLDAARRFEASAKASREHLTGRGGA